MCQDSESSESSAEDDGLTQPGDDDLQMHDPGLVPESAPFDNAVGHQRQGGDSDEVAPHVEWHDEDSGETVEAVTKNRKVKYVRCFEEINLQMAAAMIASGKYDGDSWRGHAVNNVLRSFMNRASMDANGMGKIEVWYFEGLNPMKTHGRRYSGWKGATFGMQLPPCEKKIPANLRLLSAFSLPKELKEGLRVGTNYTDLDMRVAHVQCFARRHGIPVGEAGGAIGGILADIDKHKQDMLESEFAEEHGAEQAEKLMVAVLNGLACPDGVPAWFTDMAKQITEYHEEDAKAKEAGS